MFLFPFGGICDRSLEKNSFPLPLSFQRLFVSELRICLILECPAIVGKDDVERNGASMAPCDVVAIPNSIKKSLHSQVIPLHLGMRFGTFMLKA